MCVGVSHRLSFLRHDSFAPPQDVKVWQHGLHAQQTSSHDNHMLSQRGKSSSITQSLRGTYWNALWVFPFLRKQHMSNLLPSPPARRQAKRRWIMPVWGHDVVLSNTRSQHSHFNAFLTMFSNEKSTLSSNQLTSVWHEVLFDILSRAVRVVLAVRSHDRPCWPHTPKIGHNRNLNTSQKMTRSQHWFCAVDH